MKTIYAKIEYDDAIKSDIIAYLNKYGKSTIHSRYDIHLTELTKEEIEKKDGMKPFDRGRGGNFMDEDT